MSFFLGGIVSTLVFSTLLWVVVSLLFKGVDSCRFCLRGSGWMRVFLSVVVGGCGYFIDDNETLWTLFW